MRVLDSKLHKPSWTIDTITCSCGAISPKDDNFPEKLQTWNLPEEAICPVARLPEKLRPPEGFVYFIKAAPPVNLIKIGYTTNIRNRYLHISAIVPMNISVLNILPSTNAFNLEQKLHKIFAKDQYRNEWFTMSKNIINFIEKLPPSVVDDRGRFLNNMPKRGGPPRYSKDRKIIFREEALSLTFPVSYKDL